VDEQAFQVSRHVAAVERTAGASGEDEVGALGSPLRSGEELAFTLATPLIDEGRADDVR
jgi:hypothetical protein